jgi:hypothetical protein
VSRDDFRDQLRPFLDVTVAELRGAMEKIPRRIVIQLAQGPLPDPYACRICRTFGKQWYTNEPAWDRHDPMHIVFCYHEVPKIDMVTAEDQWSGPAAKDVFNRCLDIYRIATEMTRAV